MLSYQHGYHAGNFADVIKHLALTKLLSYMTKKETPIFYLETHAGRGVYDLKSKQSLKTGEAQHGVELLWKHRAQLSEEFFPYLHALNTLNPDNALRFYPGSPWLAINALRQQDRIFCAELHPGEFEFLQNLPRQGKRVFYSNTNGFDQMHALLPPKEKRGLIFIDPSYEIKREYNQIPDLLNKAYKRFANGVYCIWYPIVDKKLHAQLLRGLNKAGVEKHLQIEFHMTASTSLGMTGCGLWIVNPPFVLAAELKSAMDALRELFNPGISSYCIHSNGS